MLNQFFYYKAFTCGKFSSLWIKHSSRLDSSSPLLTHCSDMVATYPFGQYFFFLYLFHRIPILFASWSDNLRQDMPDWWPGVVLWQSSGQRDLGHVWTLLGRFWEEMIICNERIVKKEEEHCLALFSSSCLWMSYKDMMLWTPAVILQSWGKSWENFRDVDQEPWHQGVLK